jgi:hypothetical protein
MNGEQRDNARLPRACTVSVEVVSASHDGAGSAERVECVTGDLSRNGVCLRLPRALTPGAVHHLTITYFDNEPPLQLTGEVRWCQPADGEPGRWDSGLALYNCRGSDVAAWEHLLAVLDRRAV